VYRSGDLCPTPINVMLAVVISFHPCRIMERSQLHVFTVTGTVQSLNFGCKKFMFLTFNLKLYILNYSVNERAE
jgi:hypothetical protein